VRRRFFVEKFEDDIALMEGEAAHHVGRVLRAQVGQQYELSDGERVFLGRIADVGREYVKFSLVEELPAHPNSLYVTLLLAVVKFDAFEWAIEKATELGVSTIVPLAAARSEKGLLGGSQKRSERWKKILLEASQQSRRVRLPILEELAKPEHAFTSNAQGTCVMLSERATARPLRALLSGDPMTSATLAIGPEGGWTDDEIAIAQSAGFREASLGSLILRTETAVIAALASLNYALGRD
jgi:16S rRNA (uracil1498-N3)-methyltransferase